MIKNCPNCGLPLPPYATVCPVCGTKTNFQVKSEPERINETIKNSFLKKHNVKLGPWDFALILICNIAFVMIILNLILGGICWFYYPVVILFSGYCLSFSAASKNIKRFITRYRNSIIIINLIITVCNLIVSAVEKSPDLWAYEFFIPSNLLIANTVMIILLFFSDTSIFKVMFSVFTFSFQSFILFVLLLVGVLGLSQISRILIILAFGINFISFVNLILIYFFKYRNKILDDFKLWE